MEGRTMIQRDKAKIMLIPWGLVIFLGGFVPAMFAVMFYGTWGDTLSSFSSSYPFKTS